MVRPVFVLGLGIASVCGVVACATGSTGGGGGAAGQSAFGGAAGTATGGATSGGSAGALVGGGSGDGGASGGSAGAIGGSGGATGGSGGATGGSGGAAGGSGGATGGNGGSGGATGGNGGSGGGGPGSVWINEIHYDDAGADAAEGVEVAGTAGTNLSSYSLVFYNGNPNQLKSYMTQALSGTIPDQQNGVGTLWFAKAAIQNGGADATPEPDGIALVNGSTVIQFLSYEGAFTPTDGAASGQPSTDIGVSEISTTPDGLSLQLTGTGKQYSSFSWAPPALATPGAKNGGQTFN